MRVVAGESDVSSNPNARSRGQEPEPHASHQ